MRSEVALGIAVGVSTVSAIATLAGGPWASVIDPTSASGGTAGTASAYAVTDRVSARRDGRAKALPHGRVTGWTIHLPSIKGAPLTTRDERVVVAGTAGGNFSLVEIDGRTGKTIKSTSLEGSLLIAPIMIANGTRVVLATGGEGGVLKPTVVGVDASGVQRFRTSITTSADPALASSLAPTPDGGFALGHNDEIIAFSESGVVVDRVKIRMMPPSIAVRSNGDIVAIDDNGDAFAWRAGRMLQKLGTFGRPTSGMTGAGQSRCAGGPVIDGVIAPSATERRERIICVQNSKDGLKDVGKILALDVASGTKTTLYAGSPVPIRTAPAIGANGMIVAASQNGALVGVTSTGIDIGFVEIPGALSVVTGKDGGVIYPSSGTPLAPLVDDEDGVVFGGSDGFALAAPGAPIVLLSLRCATRPTGASPIGARGVVIACESGELARFDEVAGVAPHD